MRRSWEQGRARGLELVGGDAFGGLENGGELVGVQAAHQEVAVLEVHDVGAELFQGAKIGGEAEDLIAKAKTHAPGGDFEVGEIFGGVKGEDLDGVGV